jgi:hypothetical protein
VVLIPWPADAGSPRHLAALGAGEGNRRRSVVLIPLAPPMRAPPATSLRSEPGRGIEGGAWFSSLARRCGLPPPPRCARSRGGESNP